MKNFMKTVLVALALLTATMATAQTKSPVSLGIEGGMNVSNMSNTIGTSSRIGYNVGLALDYDLSHNFAVMSGLHFTTKGFDVKGVDASLNSMYLQLPLHLAYNLQFVPDMFKVHFGFGPYVACGVGGKVKGFDDRGYNIEQNTFDAALDRFDFGLGVDAGVTIDRIMLRLGYDFGLVNVAKDGDTKNQNFYISIRYKFRK